MKLVDCNMCDLCNRRSHISFPKGKAPAKVMVILSKEPRTESSKDRERRLLREINYELQWSWYKTYAVKCSVEGKVEPHHLRKCKKWLKAEIKKVNPRLVVLMGDISQRTLLGSKAKNLKKNIFYEYRKRMYFAGNSVIENDEKVEENINRILLFIRKCI